MHFVQLVAIVNIYTAHCKLMAGERGWVTSSPRDNQVATEDSEVAHLSPVAAVPSPVSPDLCHVSELSIVTFAQHLLLKSYLLGGPSLHP